MTFEARYSDDQRTASVTAVLDRGIRPHRVVLELAAAGELTMPDGRKLPAFELRDPTLRTWVQRERKRRAGRIRSDVAKLPPRDAIEHLRQRLVSAADAMLDDLEQQLQRNAKTTDPERLRQIVRVVREAAALPGPGDERPAKPGAKTNGKQDGGQTRGGLAGDILADHRASSAGPTTGDDVEPAPPHPPLVDDSGDSTRLSPSSHARLDDTNGAQHGEPGAFVRELAASHGVELPPA